MLRSFFEKGFRSSLKCGIEVIIFIVQLTSLSRELTLSNDIDGCCRTILLVVATISYYTVEESEKIRDWTYILTARLGNGDGCFARDLVLVFARLVPAKALKMPLQRFIRLERLNPKNS